ncbi:MAG: tRNA uridine-5-carboxymethylaminomethyl(34) synthesis enzyme MnmG [Bacteroidetes bacterium GWA2_32_17]|nr:MAG: tRNA uridine-5-carboxymethylaminomethyl(34) synthesis enzyme MnmG [Bacteroidetes bacterium GWA2_32_17]
MLITYDIIVVGAGHAGCEAASAAATLGSKTLLITHDLTKIAHMSCNPAIGGIAKGQIIREIDALGGRAGIITDKTTIQFRMLNRSKGPAMWSPRAQCDKTLFTIEWRKELESIKNLSFWQDDVNALIIKNKKVIGVKTRMGVTFKANAVILTNGTFLNGLIHIGRQSISGGRISEQASFGLTEQIVKLGFKSDRMKTGTPARLDGRTINFTQLIEQKSDENPEKFSFLPNVKTNLQQQSCFIAHTNVAVHKILKTGFDDSPLFNGTIKSIGPRYCPSIETKLITFSDKNSHQLFIEPEGINTCEYYINGFSSSLPWDIQYKAINKIEGLQNAKIFRPGYAIEYDYFDPTQLHPTLETKLIKNLYFAGQINGTTGYEEAAAQGLMAAINAHQKNNKSSEIILNRNDAYIGVLIDDLVTKGVDEPYRMFTSRAEYRILLRQDNADSRLTNIGYDIGLASKERYEIFKVKEEQIKILSEFLKNYSIEPKEINKTLKLVGTNEINQKTKAIDLLSRPQINIEMLFYNIKGFNKISIAKELYNDVLQCCEIEIKYSGYIEREKHYANKALKFDELKIPVNFNFNKISSLSTEARQKLSKIKPKTIGQASRIPGVSPSDINILLVFLGR